ncbi:MAG TPA: ROK family protein [Chitinophaga sp.]|nr:ROK family protein [Chitinophaga sp.]
MKKSIVLAADIGGSHITSALVNMAECRIIPGSVFRAHVDANGSAASIIDSWSRIMQHSMEEGGGADCLGIAMPGPFNYEEGVSLIQGLHKYEALYGLNIKKLLADSLHMPAAQIRIANDASCFLQGELFCGAARGRRNVLGLTLGTGFGSAIAENGIAVEAAYWNTPFLSSRAEDHFSSRWFLQRYKELSGKEESGVKQIALLAIESEAAKAVFSEFGSNLAVFLQEQAFKPSVVILGGNIAHAFHLFIATLEKGLPDTRFILSALGEEAPLLGAAGFWEIAAY